MPDLTRDLILAMEEGPEFDALVDVAVMGHGYFDGGPCMRHDRLKQPAYSTDIAAAMEVEGRVYDDGRGVVYINYLMGMAGQPERGDCSGDWFHWFSVAHATPLQRCRAALLATLEKNIQEQA